MKLGIFVELTSFALSCLAAANISAAQAQAGSVGGTIGKQDKSISGGSEQPQARPKVRERVRRETPAALSVGGTWMWTAKCDDGSSSWSGKFNLVQQPDGTVSGNAEGNDGNGAMSGRVSGNSFVASRAYWNHSNTIIFTFGSGGKTMRGSEPSASHGMCKYQAVRS